MFPYGQGPPNFFEDKSEVALLGLCKYRKEISPFSKDRVHVFIEEQVKKTLLCDVGRRGSKWQWLKFEMLKKTSVLLATYTFLDTLNSWSRKELYTSLESPCILNLNRLWEYLYSERCCTYISERSLGFIWLAVAALYKDFDTLFYRLKIAWYLGFLMRHRIFLDYK